MSVHTHVVPRPSEPTLSTDAATLARRAGGTCSARRGSTFHTVARRCDFPFLVCRSLYRCERRLVAPPTRIIVLAFVCVSSFVRVCLFVCVVLCVCLVVSCALWWWRCGRAVARRGALRLLSSHHACAVLSVTQCAMRPRGDCALDLGVQAKDHAFIYLHYAISHSLSPVARLFGSAPPPLLPPLDLQFARCLRIPAACEPTRKGQKNL